MVHHRYEIQLCHETALQQGRGQSLWEGSGKLTRDNIGLFFFVGWGFFGFFCLFGFFFLFFPKEFCEGKQRKELHESYEMCSPC